MSRIPTSDREWDYADDDRPLRQDDDWREDDAVFVVPDMDRCECGEPKLSREAACPRCADNPDARVTELQLQLSINRALMERLDAVERRLSALEKRDPVKEMVAAIDRQRRCMDGLSGSRARALEAL